MHFEITPEQQAKVLQWMKEMVRPQVIAKQRLDPTLVSNRIAVECWNDGYPYEGASGGGLTYEFTPTGIGVAVWVRYGEHKLDITDYDAW